MPSSRPQEDLGPKQQGSQSLEPQSSSSLALVLPPLETLFSPCLPGLDLCPPHQTLPSTWAIKVHGERPRTSAATGRPVCMSTYPAN